MGRLIVGSLVDATEEMIGAAGHLTDQDAGMIAAIRALALKIDVADDYFRELAEQAAIRKHRPPSQDNVSLPTYLKYCAELLLTPASRERTPPAKTGGTGGSKLAQLRSVHGGTA